MTERIDKETGSLTIPPSTQRSLEALRRKFPDSLRVKRLEGMCLEANDDYDAALAFYEETLGAHPTSSVIWKRKVAVHKAIGDTSDAIRELTKYLEV